MANKGFIGLKFPDTFFPIEQVLMDDELMIYSTQFSNLRKIKISELPFGVDEQAVINLVNTNTSINAYNAARLGGNSSEYYAPASSLTSYYTKQEADNTFAPLTHHHNDLYLTLSTWNQMFELVPNDGNPYIKAKLDFLGQGEITAYATGSSGSMWDSMPVATATTLGGVMVSPGSGLKMVGSQLQIDGDTFNLNNYYTKINLQTSGQAQVHFNNITNTPTTLGGYGITDAYNQSYINSNFININQKGVVNGVATLDGGAKIPISQIPDSVVGQVSYEGTWNASTNTPSLPPVPAEKGHYYVVSAAGTQFGISFQTGDWIISNGSAWQKVDNTDAVITVFGRLGNIVANATDYNAFYLRHDTASQSLTTTQRSNARTNLDVYSTTQVTASLALKVNKAGDTMTNKLTISNSNYLSHLDLVRGSIKFEFAPSTANGGELRFLATNATQYIFDKKMAVGGSNVESGYMIDVNGNLIVRGNIIAQGEITAYATGSSGSMWDGMPVATATTLGGVMVSSGSGLKMVGSQLQIDGDTFNLNNYYTKTNIDEFFAGTASKTGYNKSDWDAAYSWGNHNSAGYLTSFTETDPTVPSHVKAITTTNISNWNTAYTNNLRWSGTATGLDAVAGRASLGLGTAATRNVGTSSGNVMEVGAFGLGAATSLVKSYSEWDDLSLPTALYRSTSASDSVFDLAGVGLNLSYSNTYAAQLHIGIVGSALKIQARATTASGVWGAVKEVYHTGNLPNPIQGSGTGNYIPKFTAGATLGNSSIYEIGGAVAIAKTSVTSGYKLDVNGGVIAAGELNTYNHRILAASAGGDRYIELNRGGSTYGATGWRDWMIKANESSSIQFLAKINNSETLLAEITSAGNIYATGNITASGEVTAYTASDARLKTNIASLSSINALNLIERLNPVTYTWNERALELNGSKSLTQPQYGLIAQELEEVIPDLIRPIYGDYKTYDDRGLMTLMLQAIKELKSEVDKLKSKN